MKKLILGSSSPRRVELLGKLGLDFEKMSPDVDETLTGSYSPEEFVRKIALKKAKSLVENNFSSDLIDKVLLTADTVVVLGSKVIGKPKSKDEAREVLKELSGRTHSVYTGICYTYKEPKKDQIVYEEAVTKTQVLFKKLGEEEIESYIATDEPYDKAGAYAIQGNSSFMVKEIKGSFTNVVGLPLAEVSDKLKDIL